MIGWRRPRGDEDSIMPMSHRTGHIARLEKMGCRLTVLLPNSANNLTTILILPTMEQLAANEGQALISD